MAKFKCKHCKKFFDTTQRIRVPAGSFCSRDHAAAFAIEASKKHREKVLKKIRFKENNQLRKRKYRTLTHLQKCQLVQPICNKYIRLRDKHMPCISCGKLDHEIQPWNGRKWDAGHYRTVKAANHLRFNTDNIHKQCVHCNWHRSGNQVGARAGIVERIGESRVLALENDNKPHKFSDEELEDIKQSFKAKIKELEALSE